MPWTTKNIRGEEVTWYTEKEYNMLKEEVMELRAENRYLIENFVPPYIDFSWEAEEEL